jgi:hypothetical protein
MKKEKTLTVIAAIIGVVISCLISSKHPTLSGIGFFISLFWGGIFWVGFDAVEKSREIDKEIKSPEEIFEMDFKKKSRKNY